jgi:hypothetical protein
VTHMATLNLMDSADVEVVVQRMVSTVNEKRIARIEQRNTKNNTKTAPI